MPPRRYVSPEGSPHLTHYYGDSVRMFMLVAVALMLLSAPFYSDSLLIALPFEIIGAIILAGLAAMTNPMSRLILSIDAVANGVGLVIFATWGLSAYESSGALAFVIRIAIAVIFLFAFYYSMKTVRAMVMHTIGDGIAEEDGESAFEKVIEDIEMIPRDKDMARELEELEEEGAQLKEDPDIQDLQQRSGEFD